ncbi:MAG: peptidoglycan-associated lipoprotein Pal [Candidatus Sulfobium sp.]
MKRYWVFLLVFVVAIAFGCSQRAITQPETQPAQQKEQTKEGMESKTPEKVTEAKVGSNVESVGSKEMEIKGQEGKWADILFDFDKYDVKAQYKDELTSIADWMTGHTGATLSIEGNTDERGTNEYNLALGDRRAKAVKDYLVSLGVPSSRVETLSYGEEKPLCKEHNEACWARNRRAHFVILGGGK